MERTLIEFCVNQHLLYDKWNWFFDIIDFRFEEIATRTQVDKIQLGIVAGTDLVFFGAKHFVTK